ncbi:MAG: hypothetical protein OEW42_09845 [Acidimicrobiia bacterium]|nr:hypothetical protein [Acidimicrobiia bacterium]MDH5238055.1 hypothetical protein [Acidimicrobiia bacterium]
MLFATERFAELATITAQELEFTDARLVVVDHPLGGTDPDRVAAWGRDTLDRLRALLGP